MSPASTADRSTLDDLEPGARSRVDDLFRWLLIAGIVAVLVLGLVGRLGPRQATATSARGGLTLSVRYDSVNRPGLGATWEVTVTSTDGPLPAEVDLTTSSAYLDIFDEHGLGPEPLREVAGPDDTTWTFEPEPGSTSLVVSLDARVQPGWKMPVTGRTTLSVPDRESLTVSYRTVLLP